jgi:hypothetical protein
MDWAVILEGRADRATVLMILEERDTAETIAAELRERGQPVVVRGYPLPGTAAKRTKQSVPAVSP